MYIYIYTHVYILTYISIYIYIYIYIDTHRIKPQSTSHSNTQRTIPQHDHTITIHNSTTAYLNIFGVLTDVFHVTALVLWTIQPFLLLSSGLTFRKSESNPLTETLIHKDARTLHTRNAA